MPYMLPTQLRAANRKLLIASCDRKLSDHVTAVTANHGSHMIIQPVSWNPTPLKGLGGAGSKGLIIVYNLAQRK